MDVIDDTGRLIGKRKQTEPSTARTALLSIAARQQARLVEVKKEKDDAAQAGTAKDVALQQARGEIEALLQQYREAKEKLDARPECLYACTHTDTHTHTSNTHAHMLLCDCMHV